MKLKNILIITMSCLMSIMTFIACSDEDSEYGSIYGIVTVNGEPLKGIGVSLFVDDALLLKTVTYDDGAYEFTDLTPRYYTLVVEDERYEKFTTSVVVESGRQARADMKLTPKKIYMTVSTKDTDIEDNSVIMYGNYKYTSPYEPHEYGFFYGTSSNPSQSGKQITGELLDYNGLFAAEVTNLSAGTYYYQAYAKNSKGIAYGDVLTFSFSGQPVVQTLQASNVTETSAILNGEVLFQGAPSYTERGFIYSANYTTPTITEGTKIKISGTGEGTFSYKLTGLNKNETYYARAYVKNESNVTYGDVISFETNTATFIDKGDYVILKAEGIMVQKQDLSISTHNAATSLCNGSRIGGYSDWRLPTIGELGTLYNKREQIGGFTTGNYWSNTRYNYNDYYYNLSFSSGRTDYNSSSHQFSVRAVRTIE